jgi:hypothetical protein
VVDPASAARAGPIVCDPTAARPEIEAAGDLQSPALGLPCRSSVFDEEVLSRWLSAFLLFEEARDVDVEGTVRRWAAVKGELRPSS